MALNRYVRARIVSFVLIPGSFLFIFTLFEGFLSLCISHSWSPLWIVVHRSSLPYFLCPLYSDMNLFRSEGPPECVVDNSTLKEWKEHDLSEGTWPCVFWTSVYCHTWCHYDSSGPGETGCDPGFVFRLLFINIFCCTDTVDEGLGLCKNELRDLFLIFWSHRRYLDFKGRFLIF